MSRAPITGLRVRDSETRAQLLASAHAWRIRMKPHFDAIYGEEPHRCPTCGSKNRSA